MRQPTNDYDETLSPPVSWWALGAALAGAVWWCFWVATPWQVSSIAGVVSTAAVSAVLIRYGAVRIAIDGDVLRAGDAVLPRRYVGAVDVLDADQTRALLGVEADARAHLVVRAYCPRAVKVAVVDERDPTPYWVISTRHGDELALHLRPRSMQD